MVGNKDFVNNAIQIRRRKAQARGIWINTLFRAVAFAIFVMIVFTFVLGVKTVETTDMYPAVRAGDTVFYYRLGNISNQDIVLYEKDGQIRTGRVAATEGTPVNRTEGGLLMINGNIQPKSERSGIFYKTEIRRNGKLKYPSRVPKGYYLILGDNRKDATDSRAFGYVSRDEIKGKLFTIMRRTIL